MYTKQINVTVCGSGRGTWYHGQGVGWYAPGTKGEVSIDKSQVPRARRQGLGNLVKKYASVKCFVTENASKVYVDGAYKK